VSLEQWSRLAGDASFRRCDVGNRWNERHSDGGKVSGRPIGEMQDVFDIGGSLVESHREAGPGSA
jgi:hypothetical protein